jgi:hypothetical protein
MKLTVNMDSDKELTAHFAKIVTPTPEPTLTPTTPPCRKPADVTKEDVGDRITVCGKVTNFGDVPCPACAWGRYGYLKLDKEFLIISYEWSFSEDWLDYCTILTDTIELMGAEPVAIFAFGEEPGVECWVDNETGQRTCNIDDYFRPWYDCD